MSDVSHYILTRLREWGIHRIYGYPGDGINGFLRAFEDVDGDPVFTQTRHEEMAAFMACAHAKLDHQPVIAVVGQQKRHSVGAHDQQEIDL